MKCKKCGGDLHISQYIEWDTDEMDNFLFLGVENNAECNDCGEDHTDDLEFPTQGDTK